MYFLIGHCSNITLPAKGGRVSRVLTNVDCNFTAQPGVNLLTEEG